jgi:hypothetical protein
VKDLEKENSRLKCLVADAGAIVDGQSKLISPFELLGLSTRSLFAEILRLIAELRP